MFAGIEELTAEPVSVDTNARHLESPEPGDYWNEMMRPALLVLARNASGVLVIEDTVEKGSGWMWNFDKAKTISLDDLREKTRHCFCYPRFHEKAIGWWKEHIGIE